MNKRKDKKGNAWKKAMQIVLIMLVGTLFTGCATGFNRARPVTIKSQPAGAEVLVDDRYEGKTPCRLNLDPRAKEYRLKLVAKDHNDIEVLLKTNFGMPGTAYLVGDVSTLVVSPFWTVGLLAGVPLTGSTYKSFKEGYEFKLSPRQQAQVPSSQVPPSQPTNPNQYRILPPCYPSLSGYVR